jgi:hypothetical protein
MSADAALRAHVTKLLEWQDAHVTFDAAVKGIPPELRGRVPDGAPYSLWQLVEHIRLAQHDILDFCVNPDYQEMKWPDDYWPGAAPPSGEAWDESVAAYFRDRRALVALAENPQTDLFARIPHGSGQTYLRELLLTADHTAYHVGQVVIVRRLLGIWASA